LHFTSDNRTTSVAASLLAKIRTRIMSHRTVPIIVLLLTLLSVTPLRAQQPTPPDSAAAAPVVDSLQAALDRFETTEPPTDRDSTRLRQWADSVAKQDEAFQRSRPAQTRAFFREALEAYRALSDSAGTASIIHDLGATYYYQGRHDRALTQLHEALSTHREIGDRQGVADALTDIGTVYRRQGRYEEALDRYQEVLEIARELGDREGTAGTLNNIGITYAKQARYEKALTNLREALDLVREYGERRSIPGRLINIGNIYRRQGQYEEAIVHYREALKLFREMAPAGNRGVAVASNNIGIVRKTQGRYEEALTRYRESLSIYRKLADQGGVADALSNIGIIRSEQDRYEEALARYRESLSIYRDIGERRGVASALNNIGGVYARQDRYEEALSHFREALEIRREIGDRKGLVGALENLGEMSLEWGDVQGAADTLRLAVREAERLRLNTTSPEARRSLMSVQVGVYQSLTEAHLRAGQPDSALRSTERARARLLTDRLAGAAQSDTAFAIPSVEELRQALGPEEAALLYLNAGTDWPLAAVAVTADTTVARELPDSTVRQEIGREYPIALSRLRREEGPMKTALREGGLDASGDPGEPPSLAEIIRLYRQQLTGVEGTSEMEKDLARRFHRLLIEPMSEALAEKDELVLVPGGALGYLPFETLRDSTGQYLVENRHVRYAQSLTVLRQLKQRDYGDRERPLLALGGAEYGYPPTQRGQSLLATSYRGSTNVATEEHASTLRRDAGRRLGQGKSSRPSYAELGFGRWRNLPGTKSEVTRLGTIAGKQSTVITGEAASEPKVRGLSQEGRLDDYRRVHFATHGVSVPEAPALSALVLSQVGASDSLAARDGYLNMQEIADLDLRSDVAVLSACQTGLGRIVAGEGVVSLSHAFLRAGANATLVSQWKVLDKSTRQFMTAVYRRAKNEDTSFAEAVTETKRAFIGGEYGEKNKDPLRWAPFVYYGRE